METQKKEEIEKCDFKDCNHYSSHFTVAKEYICIDLVCATCTRFNLKTYDNFIEKNN
jgi:hypothetical protein